MLALDSLLACAFTLIDALFAQHLQPPPSLTVSQWADANRVLSQKSSAQPGRWHTARTPYLREPMDAFRALRRAQRVADVRHPGGQDRGRQ
jgi:phage terminase large subunit GpA-like protein